MRKGKEHDIKVFNELVHKRKSNKVYEKSLFLLNPPTVGTFSFIIRRKEKVTKEGEYGEKTYDVRKSDVLDWFSFFYIWFFYQV